MGYMGFGMRKENYTRKPKKVFEKIKRTEKQLRYSTKKKTTDTNKEKVNEYTKKQHSNDKTGTYLIALRILLSVIISLAVLTILVLYVLELRKAYDYSPVADSIFQEATNKEIKTKIYKLENGLSLEVEYFDFSQKSAQTKYKNGLKHQNTESFYYTGQQLRAAQYFHGELVQELYFYKDGDTIRNFPKINDHLIHEITSTHKGRRISFWIKDGKLIKGSYVESNDLGIIE